MTFGLPLPASPEREQLSAICNKAYGEYYASWGIPNRQARINQIADSIGEIVGVELLRPSNYSADRNNLCIHFTFGEILGEEWAAPHAPLPDDFWLKSLAFLVGRGYRQVPEWKKAADIVVAYTFGSEGAPDFRHFGIAVGPEIVVSKFGQGPVVRHGINVVPDEFGDKAYFFESPTAGRAAIAADLQGDGRG